MSCSPTIASCQNEATKGQAHNHGGTVVLDMELHVSSELDTLRRLLPLFRDVAKFYTGSHERAVRARRTINKKQGRNKPFHASIWVDLKFLCDALDQKQNLSGEQSAYLHDLREATRDLLQVLDEDFVRFPDDASIDSESSVGFRTLRNFSPVQVANPLRRFCTISDHSPHYSNYWIYSIHIDTKETMTSGLNGFARVSDSRDRRS